MHSTFAASGGATRLAGRPSSFILHPSSFILHPSGLHPSSFILHPSSFRPSGLHPSSFILPASPPTPVKRFRHVPHYLR
ncbi:MAG: hypothetical protein ACXW31_14670 [Thermoanaerobaculia bacterium]